MLQFGRRDPARHAHDRGAGMQQPLPAPQFGAVALGAVLAALRRERRKSRRLERNPRFRGPARPRSLETGLGSSQVSDPSVTSSANSRLQVESEEARAHAAASLFR